MVDKEMLSAMSGLLDEKLEGLKTDVAELKTDVAELKTDVAGLKTDVAGLKLDVNGLKADVSGLKTDVSDLKADVSDLKGQMKHVRIELLENGVLPRLSTIESCYLDTSHKYMERTEQFDQMAEDIKVMKTVVLNHSSRLNKIPV